MAYGRVRFTKDPQKAAYTKDLRGSLPAWVERTSDKCNHLFEQLAKVTVRLLLIFVTLAHLCNLLTRLSTKI